MNRSEKQQPTSSAPEFSVSTLDFSKGVILEDLIERGNVRDNLIILVLVAEGEGGVRMNLKEIYLKKNDLLIIPPDATKEPVFVSEDAVLKVVACTSDFLRQLNLSEGFGDVADYYSTKLKPVWSLLLSEVKRLESLIDQLEMIQTQAQAHPYAKEIIEYTFMILILEMTTLAPKYTLENNQHITRKELLTVQFYALAKKHFHEHRELKFYADALFVTPKHLTETVKEVSQHTAGETIDNFIVQEAKIQLRTTNIIPRVKAITV